MIGRRNGLARGIYNHSAADVRFSGPAVLREEQFSLNAVPRHGGFPAYQMELKPNRTDSYTRKDDDSNLDSVYDTSTSGQFAQQWKLRALAQGATLKEIAKIRLRRFVLRNGTPECTNAHAAGPIIRYELFGREPSAKRRGPAEASEMESAGSAEMFQTHVSRGSPLRDDTSGSEGRMRGLP